MPLLIRWLPSLLAAFGGERHFKAAARTLAALAVLVNGYARQLGEEGLGHAADLGVLRRHSGQRAAVAPDHDLLI
jgi:hypothetical protein